MTQIVPPITQNFGRPSWRPGAASGLDPDMRRMALVALAMGGAVALAIGAVSLSHRVHHGVPVIEAASGPVRVRPLDPGGMTVAGAEDAATGVEALAPAAEKPALRALHARTHASTAPKAAGAEPRPAIAAALRAEKASVLQPVVPALPPPVPLSRTTPAQPIHATSALPTRGASVQLAAFESQQAAEQDWDRLAARMPGLFDGHRPNVEKAQLAGRTVYRLRTGGFADIAAATTFCGKVRAHGGDCTLAAS